MRLTTIAATFAAGAILIMTTTAISDASATDKRTVKPRRPPIVKPRIPRLVKPAQQDTAPLAITSPQKYEGWGTDAKHTITWTTTLPASTNLKIELIQNDAAQTLFRTLASSTANTGSYEWAGIPAAQFNSVSRSLKVRLTTADNAHTGIRAVVQQRPL